MILSRTEFEAGFCAGHLPAAFHTCRAWGLFALLCLLLAGCQTSSRYAFSDLVPPPATPGAMNYGTNVLQEGDVISITFQYSTNYNTVQKIPLDGLLNLESVGQARATGKTPLAFQAELAQLYKPQIKNDVVTVKLVTAAAGVYISGAVFHPGRVVMERPMTVLEAVMEAGGFDPNRANLAGVTVLRVENGKQRTHPVNLKKVLRGKDDSPFYLKPFDIIYVPTKTFSF